MTDMEFADLYKELECSLGNEFFENFIRDYNMTACSSFCRNIARSNLFNFERKLKELEIKEKFDLFFTAEQNKEILKIAVCPGCGRELPE